MANPTIVNAAPKTIMLGVNDLSTRQVPVEPEAIPQHLPFIYLYAQKGPEDPQLVVGNSAALVYGAETFDLRKPYATHQTVLATEMNKAANAMFIKRLKPADAKTASIRVYADVLATKVPNYLRNTDGSIKKDTNGDPMPASPATIDGHSVKFVLTKITIDAEGKGGFGQATILDGDQTDMTAGIQSQRIPLFDAPAGAFGSDFNLAGLRIYAPTINSSDPIDTRLIVNQKVYPFRISVMRKPSALSSPTIVKSLAGSSFIDCVLQRGFINENLNKEMYVGDVFMPAYQDLSRSGGMPRLYGDFAGLHFYDDNIKMLLDQFVAAELPHLDDFSDLVADDEDQAYRFNLFGGVNSSGSPYHSYHIKMTAADEFYFTENSVIYAQGGADGTMGETKFAEQVLEDALNFANPSHDYQNTAIYPWSDIYDTGYPLATKFALINFIANRKDVKLSLACHDVLGPQLSAEEEQSVALALLARVRNYPESEYFGTPTMRALIMGRSGTLIGSDYKKPLPLVIEVAAKRAGFMGAGDGKWKSGENYDYNPGNMVKLFKDINITSVPDNVKNVNWDDGLNWVEYYDTQRLYIPALQTVYNDDTSILKSDMVTAAICYIQKVGERARRNFSGAQTLTNEQLVDNVNKFVIDNTEGRFLGIITVVPACYITKMDDLRGYSWTLPIKVYGPNMKTVETLYIESYRNEDLPS